MKSVGLKYRIIFGLLLFAVAVRTGWLGAGSSIEKSEAEYTVSQSSRALKKEEPPSEAQLLGGLSQEKERMRKAIEMALHLPASEIRSWLESGKFSMSGGYSLTLFERIAFDRWALEKPADFLDWVIRNPSSRYDRQFQIIVENHPEILSRIIDQNAGTSGRRLLLRTLAGVSPDFALTEFRRLLPDLVGREFGFGIALSILMEKRPEELLALFSDPVYANHPELAAIVLQHQLKEDFNATFEILLTRLDGYKLLFGGNSRLQGIEPELLLARLPDFPEGWREQLTENPSRFRILLGDKIDALSLDFTEYGFAENDANRLRIRLAELEMRRSPKGVLGRLHTLGFDQETKEYLIVSLLEYELSSKEYEQLASALNDPADRRTLEDAVVAFRGEYRRDNTQLSNRDELFSSLGQEVENYRQLSLDSWDEGERAKLEAEFDSLPPDQKSEVSKVIHRNSSGLLSGLESKALIHLIAEESTTRDINDQGYSSYNNAASGHVLELMNSDPGQASSWINQLPRGSVRLLAEKNLAANWHNYDPELAQQWIDSQPVETRKAIEEFLESK